jgi:hypothetical protein
MLTARHHDVNLRCSARGELGRPRANAAPCRPRSRSPAAARAPRNRRVRRSCLSSLRQLMEDGWSSTIAS